MAYNYLLPAPDMQQIDLTNNMIWRRLNDLNLLFDAIDVFKPVTVKTYAQKKGVTVQSVYKQIKRNTICHFTIDGVIFIID